MTVAEPRAGSAESARAPGRAARIVVLTLLGIDGVLCAVTAALLLPTYIGRFPFPVSALVGGLVNAVLVWAGLHWTPSLRLAAMPLWTWLLTVALLSFSGPGDDFVFAGRGVMAYGVVLMIVAGSAPPAALLWWRKYRRAGLLRWRRNHN